MMKIAKSVVIGVGKGGVAKTASGDHFVGVVGRGAQDASFAR